MEQRFSKRRGLWSKMRPDQARPCAPPGCLAARVRLQQAPSRMSCGPCSSPRLQAPCAACLHVPAHHCKGTRSSCGQPHGACQTPLPSQPGSELHEPSHAPRMRPLAPRPSRSRRQERTTPGSKPGQPWSSRLSRQPARPGRPQTAEPPRGLVRHTAGWESLQAPGSSADAVRTGRQDAASGGTQTDYGRIALPHHLSLQASPRSASLAPAVLGPPSSPADPELAQGIRRPARRQLFFLALAALERRVADLPGRASR